MSYVVGSPMQPMLIQQAQDVPAEKSTKLLTSYVGRWFSALRLICMCTMLFSVFGLLFSVLDEYNEQGEKTKDGTSFESLTGETGFLFALPIFFPLFVLVFMSAESFASERSNEGKNVDGKTAQSMNGQKVRRMVFGNVLWALFVTFFTWSCFIGSFSVFYSFGIPRCTQENQDRNTGLSFEISKKACFLAFEIDVVKFILAAIIVIASCDLWFWFYFSMPMTHRKRAKNKVAQQQLVARRSVAQKFTTTANKERQKKQQRVANNSVAQQFRKERQKKLQRIAKSSVAQKLTAANKKKKAAKRAKAMANQLKQGAQPRTN